MKNSILATLLVCSSLYVNAQKNIEKALPTQPGDKVYLDFRYAKQVNVTTWEKSEVVLLASVSIDKGEYDDLYEIVAEKNGTRLEFYSDTDELEEKWDTFYSSDDCCNRHGVNLEVNIEVQMPANLDLDFNSISGSIKAVSLTGNLHFNTISGDITLTPVEKSFHVKTISGDVELLVQEPMNVDLSAKTISGEIYSNLDLEYLDGKRGLRQVVGQKVKARLNDGGEEWEMETISGNIFLRRI